MAVEGEVDSCGNEPEESVPLADRIIVTPAEQPVRATAARAAIRMKKNEKLRLWMTFLLRVEE
ncbi:MAG TPA: hypothetical protein VFB43_04090 [Terracidiphilus sp.]|nr:hypothetical protein [Terracidiphilus sp.]